MRTLGSIDVDPDGEATLSRGPPSPPGVHGTKNPQLKIGRLQVAGIALRNRVVLAPMSGVTDGPFRDLAHAWNAGLTVTEMVASRELARERPQDIRKAKPAHRTGEFGPCATPVERHPPAPMPHVVQHPNGRFRPRSGYGAGW